MKKESMDLLKKRLEFESRSLVDWVEEALKVGLNDRTKSILENKITTLLNIFKEIDEYPKDHLEKIERDAISWPEWRKKLFGGDTVIK